MNCDDIGRQMEAMLDGALDQQAAHEIMAHLSCCPGCQSRWAQLEGLRPLLQRVAMSAPSESLERRVMSAFHKRHASGTSAMVKWRALPLPPGIPKPVFAVILLAVIMAALMGAFVLGRVTATQIVVPAQPTLTASSPGAPSSTPPESGVERPKSAQFRTEAERNRSRQPVHRTAVGASGARTSTANPLESFATVSPSGTNYSTKASLDGFEPLRGAKVRVVKGEDQK